MSVKINPATIPSTQLKDTLNSTKATFIFPAAVVAKTIVTYTGSSLE